VESKGVNRYLTFRYATTSGHPRLIRYETPNINGAGVDDELARPLPQELPGRWGNGEFVLTTVEVTQHAQLDRDKEGCDQKVIAALNKKKNRPMPLAVNIKQIDLVGAPGLGGTGVHPSQVAKRHFPGTLTITLTDPESKQAKPTESTLLGFAYDYRDRTIRLEKGEKNSVTRVGGRFYQNATHYTMRGTWKTWIMRGKHDAVRLGGTWMVKKRKRSGSRSPR
jgi:hypothetical protein